ncbi:clavesin-2 [Macrosteles quadrilineatus]|uniref:clavesin-2 n=1 Tax=Macrosteles quadrilineatus TaxID=74068 RepID=UPI0023E33A53|nr:clavesin-2 [Macrosteles quadrilineatus]
MGCGYENGEEDTYQCTLSSEMQTLAQQELREDEATRSHAITQMRSWIDMHPEIQCCRKDSAFLLRFLRTKKFCLPMAQEMLEKYLIVRQLYPQWFQRLDVLDPEVQDILNSGYLVALPERDRQGRKVLFSCAVKFDPYKYTSAHMARVHSIVVESLMDEEENQITGYSHVNDESGLTMGHISLWSLNDIRNMLRCIQNSTPMRHKSTHFINVPPYANKVFDFFTALLNDKLKNRVMLHKDIESLQKAVDPKILPKEYGGVVPLSDMIADFKKFLESKRERVMALDKMTISVNKKAKFITEFEDQQITGMAGSFRKLQVD